MEARIHRRYSNSFKRQVIDELEKGRFSSIEEARRHYEIGGTATISKWLRRYGYNHLCAKVVIVQTPDEKEQIRQLKSKLKQLEQALGRTQVDNLVHQEYLKLACEQLGEEVESFKKKAATQSPIGFAPEAT